MLLLTHHQARRFLFSSIQLSPKSGRRIYDAKALRSGMLLQDMMNNFSLFGFSSPCESAIRDKVVLSFKAAPLNPSSHSSNGPPSAHFF
jgi:hypothetical protein